MGDIIEEGMMQLKISFSELWYIAGWLGGCLALWDGKTRDLCPRASTTG